MEYIRCLHYHNIKVSSFIYELVIVLLVRNNKFYQLHQFLQYHVITDSFHVACQLLSLEKTYPPAFQLAIDMLKRTYPEHIIEILLSKGKVIEALRYLKHQGNDPGPLVKRFFKEALQSNDPTVFYKVYNYFQSSKDFSTVRSDQKKVKKWFRIKNISLLSSVYWLMEVPLANCPG